MGAREQLRLGLTGLVLVLVATAGIVLWSLTVTSLALIVLSLGIPATIATVGATRRMADLHRRWVGEFTGVPVGRPYRPVPDDGLLPMFRALVKDPATWRDLAWLLVNGTVGLAIALIPGSLLLASVWYLALPLVYLVFGAGAPRMDMVLFTIEDLPSSFFGWGLAVLSVLLLVVAGRPVLRLYAWLTRSLLAPTARARLDRRVTQLAESRTETIDTQAAELRRIERDLHDGAQARLVSLGMNIGLAEHLVTKDPEAAVALLSEAAKSSAEALAELRGLVRGIHPPVLADRGLDGAIQAIALSSAIPIEVHIDLPGRAPAPVESALYFAVAEIVANLGKHSEATEAWIRIEYSDGLIHTSVGDNGRGGAVPKPGSGLHGVERRLSAFDGTMLVSSPPAGPTIVTMELPCVLSSRKISPSSGTA